MIRFIAFCLILGLSFGDLQSDNLSQNQKVPFNVFSQTSETEKIEEGGRENTFQQKPNVFNQPDSSIFESSNTETDKLSLPSIFSENDIKNGNENGVGSFGARPKDGVIVKSQSPVPTPQNTDLFQKHVNNDRVTTLFNNVDANEKTETEMPKIEDPFTITITNDQNDEKKQDEDNQNIQHDSPSQTGGLLNTPQPIVDAHLKSNEPSPVEGNSYSNLPALSNDKEDNLSPSAFEKEAIENANNKPSVENNQQSLPDSKPIQDVLKSKHVISDDQSNSENILALNNENATPQSNNEDTIPQPNHKNTFDPKNQNAVPHLSRQDVFVLKNQDIILPSNSEDVFSAKKQENIPQSDQEDIFSSKNEDTVPQSNKENIFTSKNEDTVPQSNKEDIFSSKNKDTVPQSNREDIFSSKHEDTVPQSNKEDIFSSKNEDTVPQSNKEDIFTSKNEAIPETNHLDLFATKNQNIIPKPNQEDVFMSKNQEAFPRSNSVNIFAQKNKEVILHSNKEDLFLSNNQDPIPQSKLEDLFTVKNQEVVPQKNQPSLNGQGTNPQQPDPAILDLQSKLLAPNLQQNMFGQKNEQNFQPNSLNTDWQPRRLDKNSLLKTKQEFVGVGDQQTSGQEPQSNNNQQISNRNENSEFNMSEDSVKANLFGTKTINDEGKPIQERNKLLNSNPNNDRSDILLNSQPQQESNPTQQSAVGLKNFNTEQKEEFNVAMSGLRHNAQAIWDGVTDRQPNRPRYQASDIDDKFYDSDVEDDDVEIDNDVDGDGKADRNLLSNDDDGDESGLKTMENYGSDLLNRNSNADARRQSNPVNGKYVDDRYDDDENDDDDRNTDFDDNDRENNDFDKEVNNDFDEDGDDDDDDDIYRGTDAPYEESTADGSVGRYFGSNDDKGNTNDNNVDDEEDDWYHNPDKVADEDDDDEVDDRFNRFDEDQDNARYESGSDRGGVDIDTAAAANNPDDDEELDTDDYWSRFEESRDRETNGDNDVFQEINDNEEYYRGRFPAQDILNEMDDRIEKTKPPTAPTNMVLFYTWMILVILIMVIGVSTYQAKCKGLFSGGNRQQARGGVEDRKRLLDNEFV